MKGKNGLAALGYHEMGWVPIPLCWPTKSGKCGCGKDHTGKNVGKAPLLGKNYQDLRPTREDIISWWTQWPNANVGILLEPSKLAVIDPDSPEARNEVRNLTTPHTPRAITGRGEHYYFISPGVAKRMTKRGSSKAIDILSAGYVVAPPSVHRNGESYVWFESPSDVTLAPLPPWAAEFFEEETPSLSIEAPLEGGDFSKTLSKWRKKIPRKVLRTLLADEAQVGKRSEILWWMEHEMIKAGLSHADVFTLIRGSVWNKYAGRSDEVKRLQEEIAAAVESEVVDEEPEEEEEQSSLSIRIENYPQLMADLMSYPGWLVEGFWTRRSHGFIAGEPKSFKTTIALDMAVAISSGGLFLGKFPVIEQGPVVIIQNENAPWIIKDRLMKITSSRGLLGVVTNEEDMIKVQFPPALPIYFVNQQGFNLLDPIYQKMLEKIVTETKPILVVLDPLYLMFDGDVNSAKDLNPVLSWLLDLKDKYNTGIMVIHHMNKGGGRETKRGGQRMLGSTTLHGWVESGLYITVNDPEDHSDDEDLHQAATASVTIEREFRGAGIYPKVDLTLRMGEFGEPVYNVLVEKHQEGGRGRRRANDDQLIADVLNYLQLKPGSSIRQIAVACGISRKKIGEVLKRLEDEGLITNAEEGVTLITTR